jgi:dUTP pyrophosphatase
MSADQSALQNFISEQFDLTKYHGSRQFQIGKIEINKYPSQEVLKSLDNFGIKYYLTDNSLIYKDTNALDFLSKLYDNKIISGATYDMFTEIISGKADLGPLKIKITKDNNSITPTKNFASDEGYDLTLIKIDEKISEISTRYDTGINVQPPLGYHIELLPRSSLTKSGYMLANSVGLIDASYRGTLKVVLIKVDPNASEIKLPFKAVQMILRKNHHFVLEEVKELEDTTRGSGGFGSTNK